MQLKYMSINGMYFEKIHSKRTLETCNQPKPIFSVGSDHVALACACLSSVTFCDMIFFPYMKPKIDAKYEKHKFSNSLLFGFCLSNFIPELDISQFWTNYKYIIKFLNSIIE